MHLFVEHLTVIDCAYLSETHGLVGESWITDITLVGALDDNSMVMDFAHAKKAVKSAIDDWVDHTLLVPALSQNLTFSPHHLAFAFGNGQTLQHLSPSEAICLIDTPGITIQSVASYLEKRLLDILPPSVQRVDVTLRTEANDQPYYHYVHGLKKHDGNCQRIAHGHRSRIRIARNGTHDDALTREWANRLAYSYIGTRGDITSTDATHTHFAYDAPQGRYELSYPSLLCHIIDTDSTVECIAQYIADACKHAYPHESFSVRAYEGVMKGAIATA